MKHTRWTYIDGDRLVWVNWTWSVLTLKERVIEAGCTCCSALTEQRTCNKKTWRQKRPMWCVYIYFILQHFRYKDKKDICYICYYIYVHISVISCHWTTHILQSVRSSRKLSNTKTAFWNIHHCTFIKLLLPLTTSIISILITHLQIIFQVTIQLKEDYVLHSSHVVPLHTFQRVVTTFRI
jgi:hypothetical protein